MNERELLPENADERRMFNHFVETFGNSPLLSIANSLYLQRGIVSRPGASFYEQATIQYNEIIKADAELKMLRFVDVHDINDEMMRELLSAKDVGKGRAILKRILSQINDRRR